MKKMILAAALILAGSMAHAIHRVGYTENMKCADVAAAVRHYGAVILYVNDHIYDRYVSSVRYCDVNEEVKPAWIPTMDNRQCYVGGTCAHRD